jgi:iron(III) transport system ATP-binding protein/putative spermidine/putrescine transport system ATP-binding protein/spermidine/putrescine transport system ATP-binding protein
MPSLSLDRLVKRYDEQIAVNAVSLSIRDGEFVSLLGPSGCGKSTILRMIAGLIEPSSGRILIDDRDVTRLAANQRRVGLVFQSYALFPHMTVFENVAFGLRRQGISSSALEQRVTEALASVQLQAYAQRMPRQLSGGQQQRVALARSIAPRPSILLLDEPLSNLDATLRDDMQIELRRLQREVGITTVFVTHDQTEAMAMSDRVCVLAGGSLQQFDTPEAIYHRPANGFVAGFIGRPNRLVGQLIQGTNATGVSDTFRVRLGPSLRFEVQCQAQQSGPMASGQTVDVVIRQEDLQLGTPGSPTQGPNQFEASITLRAFTGSRVQYVLAVPGGPELIALVPTNGLHGGYAVGERLSVSIDPGLIFINDRGAGP